MRNEWHATILFACQILPSKGNRTASSITRMLVFDIGTKIVLREFPNRKDLEWEIYLYHFINSLLITLTFHCTLFLIQINNEDSWKKKNRNYNKFFLCYSGLDAIYKCFLYFIFNILASSYVLVLCFLLALYENWV